MKIVLKIIGFLLLFLVLISFGAVIYVKKAFPRVEPAVEVKVEITPERVERGPLPC